MKENWKRGLALGISAVVLILGSSGCSAVMAEAKAEYPDTDVPRFDMLEDNPVSEDFLESLGDFCYQTAAMILSRGEENRLYSPLSAYYALALTAQGTKGETREEFSQLLGMKGIENFSQECGNLYRRLYQNDGKSVLQIANSLWIRQGIDIRKDYRDMALQDFYASLYLVDFQNSQTGEAMGKWISEQTGGMLQYDAKTDPSRILTILNTVWLKDAWTSPFDPANTREDLFTLADGQQVTCKFMNQTDEKGRIWRGNGYIRAQIPLRSGCKAIFILPEEGREAQEWLASPELVKEALTGGKEQRREIHWSVPIFSSGSFLELSEPLQRLGIKAAFDSEKADFSEMLDTEAVLADVSQKVRIQWDELGLEAAAYTEVAINETALMQPEEPMEIRLNRPFLYGVSTMEDLYLFVGICTDPS